MIYLKFTITTSTNDNWKTADKYIAPLVTIFIADSVGVVYA